MDGITFEIPLFLLATFAGAFVAGLSGFAFGLIAASIWLYILTPLQSATLIVAFGLMVQGYSVWKLRHALDWRKLLPFLIGAALGVPAGVSILTWANPSFLRIGVGVFLILYSLYALFRPAMSVTGGGAAADSSVGFLTGAAAVGDRLDAVIEPFARERSRKIRFVLMVGLQDLDRLAVDLAAEFVGRHACRFDGAWAHGSCKDAVHIREHADANGALDLGMGRRACENESE